MVLGIEAPPGTPLVWGVTILLLASDASAKSMTSAKATSRFL
jgi:hypothetical protein